MRGLVLILKAIESLEVFEPETDKIRFVSIRSAKQPVLIHQTAMPLSPVRKLHLALVRQKVWAVVIDKV